MLNEDMEEHICFGFWRLEKGCLHELKI